jgi:hypothetical protein
MIVGALAACSSANVTNRESDVVTIPDTTIATNPGGLGATLERYREDDVPNRIQIQVASRASTQVTLTELRLVSPAFTVLAPAATSHVVGPGQRVDLPVQLGQAQCSSPPKFNEVAPTTPPFAVAKMSVNGAAAVDVKIPITDTRGVIERLYGPACTVQAVANTATIAFGTTWTDTEFEGKPAAAGTLRIDRKNGNDPVTISEIRGSVLLRFRPEKPATGTLVVLAATERAAEVPVLLVESGDCRPHAIADSKHTFFLPAVVTVGIGPTVVIDIIPDAASQVQLSGMINRSCGLA